MPCVTEYAFLRSAPHVEAMFTCIQAFEKGDFQLLTQIDSVLVSRLKTLISVCSQTRSQALPLMYSKYT